MTQPELTGLLLELGDFLFGVPSNQPRIAPLNPVERPGENNLGHGVLEVGGRTLRSGPVCSHAPIGHAAEQG